MPPTTAAIPAILVVLMAMTIPVTPMVITMTAIAKKTATATTISNNLDPHPTLAIIAAIDSKLLYNCNSYTWAYTLVLTYLKPGVRIGLWAFCLLDEKNGSRGLPSASTGASGDLAGYTSRGALTTSLTTCESWCLKAV
uniref:Secreted protein n=1 Tax=Romanomermis culicivorax TaxID=13658 RepID=A0A915JAG5_ROMCU